MTNIGLHRANIERRSALRKDGAKRADLNRVTQGGAGAMCFNITNLSRSQISVGQGTADHPLLGGAIGHGQAAAWPILVDCGAPDHRADGITSGFSIGQPFQHDQPTALAAHIAVGRRVKRFAARISRQEVATSKDRRCLLI